MNALGTAELSPRFWDPLFAWARARNLVALPFVGSLPSSGFAPWLHSSLPTDLARLSRGGSPRQADLLIVVGLIAQKAAPTLQRTYARMADPSFVLHIRPPLDAESTRPTYALVRDIEEVLPVDVIIEGTPPSPAMLERGLAALQQRIRTLRARR